MTLKHSALLFTLLSAMQLAHATPSSDSDLDRHLQHRHLQLSIERQRMLQAAMPAKPAADDQYTPAHTKTVKPQTAAELRTNADLFNASVRPVITNASATKSRPLLMLSASAQPTSNAVNSFSGSYFLYHTGQELSYLTRGRLQLNNTDGQIWLSHGNATFDLHVDDEGFLIMTLQEPWLQYESYTHIDNSAVRFQRYMNSIEFKPEYQADGSIVFSGDVNYTHVYPDGEYADETFWSNESYLGVNANNQLNLSAILPVNQAFNLPLVQDTTNNVNYANGIVIAAHSNSQSVKVILTEKTSQSASGSWSYQIINSAGDVETVSETVNLLFNADGSASFSGPSGLNAQASAFNRPGTPQPLLNVVYQRAGSSATQASTAYESLLSIKNPAYNRSVPGIYLFKQNGLEQEYFWLELYEDGTGISAQTLGEPVNGVYANMQVIPYLWADTGAEQGTIIDMRRYRYRVASGKNGWCIPEQFSPSPQADCVLYSSRTIDFYNSDSVNGQPIVHTEHRYRFYDTAFYLEDFEKDALSYLNVDNRYFYELQQRPVPLPDIPANDNFNNAIALNGVQGQLTGSTIRATVEPGEQCYDWFCDGSSVWYRYTASADGMLELNLSAREYSYMAAFTGDSLANLVQQGSRYDTGNGMELQVEVSAGTTLYIAVSDPNHTTGSFELQWQYNGFTPIAEIQFADNKLRQCVQNSGYQYAEQLTAIDCIGVNNLGGIEHFVNLRYVTFTGDYWNNDSDSQLTDLTPLTTLNKVEELSLYYQNLTDAMLAALADFKFSETYDYPWLNLTGSQLTEASIPLLVELLANKDGAYLSIESNQFTQLGGLEQLSGLRQLYIGRNPFANLGQVMTLVSQMSNLSSLGLSGLNLTSLSGLSLPAALYSLDLSSNPIENLTSVLPFVSSDNLWFLNLSSTEISDASALAGLNLAYLYLDNSRLTNIDFVASLANLNYLGIGGTYVSSVLPLLDAPSLESVSLWDNVLIPCSELEQLAQAKPNLTIYRFDNICRLDNGFSLALTEHEGATVTGVSFNQWDGIDYSQYGSLSWQNGVLTFTPKAGVSGHISLNILIETPGVNYGYNLRLYIDPTLTRKKRRGIPKWLFVVPTTS